MSIKQVHVGGNVSQSVIITGDSDTPLPSHLSEKLDELKELRSIREKQQQYKVKKKILEKHLERRGLGIQWDDTDEMYVVYSFNSRKD